MAGDKPRSRATAVERVSVAVSEAEAYPPKEPAAPAAAIPAEPADSADSLENP